MNMILSARVPGISYVYMIDLYRNIFIYYLDWRSCNSMHIDRFWFGIVGKFHVDWVLCGWKFKLLLGYLFAWLWRLPIAYLSYLSHSTFRTCFELKRNLNKAKKATNRRLNPNNARLCMRSCWWSTEKTAKQKNRKTEKFPSIPRTDFAINTRAKFRNIVSFRQSALSASCASKFSIP